MEVGMTCRSSWMERPLFLGGMLFLLVVSVPGALSACYNIELDGAIVDFNSNGVYERDDVKQCHNHASYKNIYIDRFMYYTADWYWIVHDKLNCSTHSNHSLLRALTSSAILPENIPEHTWKEKNTKGQWNYYNDIDTECYDEHDGDDDHDDDDLSPGAIAGICIGVIVAVSLIVLILVVLCQHDKTKKTHPPPLTLPPLSTKENTPHPVVLAVPGYAHDQPTYSHQMNTYYIPPPAERYMAPPNKGYPEVPLSGATSGKEAEAVGPPTYAEITRSDEPPMKY